MAALRDHGVLFSHRHRLGTLLYPNAGRARAPVQPVLSLVCLRGVLADRGEARRDARP
jgi:hypothetical protein